MDTLGWDTGWASAFDEASRALRTPAHGHGLPSGVLLDPARVTRADRAACDTLTAAGPVRATWGADVVAASGTDPEAVPATGDWGVVATWPDGRTTVEVVLARRAAVRRKQVARGSSYAQVLAANVDAVAVVEGMSPDPDLGRVERLLTLAWSSGAEPLVVLTKADLVPDAVHLVSEVSSVAPGCAVLPVAVPDGTGLEPLRAELGEGRTLALLGASGVGKSTLLNALVGATAMGTRALRADGRGRHTTVTRELHLVPGGGAVLDTPGLRLVGLLGEESLEVVFTEVEELATRCRFADCAHVAEPGCAVLAAAASGELPERRLVSYRKLRREAEYQAARTDHRLRAERARRWRVVHTAARQRRNRP